MMAYRRGKKPPVLLAPRPEECHAVGDAIVVARAKQLWQFELKRMQRESFQVICLQGYFAWRMQWRQIILDHMPPWHTK